MEVVCCQCQRWIATKEPLDDDRTSHGFCASCEAQLVSALRQEAQQMNPRLNHA